MNKYFIIHDYSGNEKARITIYNLNGRASIWWEHLMQVKGIKEKIISWERFNKYFKEKYLSTRHYDNKRIEFNELNLGQSSMSKKHRTPSSISSSTRSCDSIGSQSSQKDTSSRFEGRRKFKRVPQG